MGQPVPFCPTRSSVPPRRTLGSSLNLPLRSCARYVPGPSSSKDVYICVRVHVISQQCMYIYISLSLSLSLRTFIYVCLSIYLFINLSLHLYLSICLSVCLSVYLCLSVWLAACLLCIYLNLSESIHLSIYVSMYLCIYGHWIKIVRQARTWTDGFWDFLADRGMSIRRRDGWIIPFWGMGIQHI